MSAALIRAPFIYFGGKRSIAGEVWRRLGTPKQYIEPFCGSLAVLLAAPVPAALEVVGDLNGFIANFWRAAKHQPGKVAEWADYPVSHIDLGARHVWLMNRRDHLGAALQDPDWPGDAKVAGWWLWGQCAWIGDGWCAWDGKIPHISNPGRGVQAIGQIPHIGDPGRGAELMTSTGRVAWVWLHRIASRLERVRIIHGDWVRGLNNHYGESDTAVFLDPPYRKYENLYGAKRPVADEVAEWAAANARLKIALCGLPGDYDLPGWRVLNWARNSPTYGGGEETNQEAVWFSPACRAIPDPKQALLFEEET